MMRSRSGEIVNRSPWDIGASHWDQRDLYTQNARTDDGGYGLGPAVHPTDGSYAYGSHPGERDEHDEDPSHVAWPVLRLYPTDEEIRRTVRLALDVRSGLDAKDVDVAVEDAVLNKLADLATFDIPQSLVEEQVEARTRRFAENLQQQGIDLQKVNLDWEKIAAEQKEGSEKQVKLEILLDAIGKSEKVEATDEDVQDQIKRLAARARTSEQAISGRLDADQKAGGATP